MCYGDLGILYAINNAIKIFDFKEFDEKYRSCYLLLQKENWIKRILRMQVYSMVVQDYTISIKKFIIGRMIKLI